MGIRVQDSGSRALSSTHSLSWCPIMFFFWEHLNLTNLTLQEIVARATQGLFEQQEFCLSVPTHWTLY